MLNPIKNKQKRNVLGPKDFPFLKHNFIMLYGWNAWKEISLAEFVEMLPEIGQDAPLGVGFFLMQRLKEYGVRIETETKALEILEQGVLVSQNGKELRLDGFDTIVLAAGMKSVNVLEEPLKAKIPEVYVIGDALAPRKAVDAIEEGARVGLKI